MHLLEHANSSLEDASPWLLWFISDGSWFQCESVTICNLLGKGTRRISCTHTVCRLTGATHSVTAVRPLVRAVPADFIDHLHQSLKAISVNGNLFKALCTSNPTVGSLYSGTFKTKSSASGRRKRFLVIQKATMERSKFHMNRNNVGAKLLSEKSLFSWCFILMFHFVNPIGWFVNSPNCDSQLASWEC